MRTKDQLFLEQAYRRVINEFTADTPQGGPNDGGHEGKDEVLHLIDVVKDLIEMDEYQEAYTNLKGAIDALMKHGLVGPEDIHTGKSKGPSQSDLDHPRFNLPTPPKEDLNFDEES